MDNYLTYLNACQNAVKNPDGHEMIESMLTDALTDNKLTTKQATQIKAIVIRNVPPAATQKVSKTKDEMQIAAEYKYGYYHSDMIWTGDSYKVENLSEKKVTLKPQFNNFCLVAQHLFPELRWSMFDRMIYLGKEKMSTTISGKIQIEINKFFKGSSISVKELQRVIDYVANHNIFNPLEEFFTALPKPTTSHLDSYLVDVCGVVDTPINRILGRKWLISAVARGMKPGCEVHSALILYGDQKAGKTSFFKIMNPDPNWYLNGKVDLSNTQKATQTFQGKFLIEFGELAQLKKNQIEDVKDYLTTKIDTYVPKFENYPVDVPRMMVFGGSSNHKDMLSDATGNRRFWCVEIPKGVQIDLKRLEEIKMDLWSEAYQAFLAGESWFLTKEQEEMLSESNNQFMEDDPLQGYLQEELELHGEDSFTATRVNEMAKKYDNKTHPRKVASVMSVLGWTSKRTNKGVVYYRPEAV